MAAPTLKVGGITFTFNEGDVSSVKSTIEPKPDPTEISATGPMGAQLYDFDGVLKKITLTGVLTLAATTRTSSGTVTSILSQKQWLESLENGSQTAITFTSTFDTQSVSGISGAVSPNQGAFIATLCMVEGFTVEEKSGDPGRLPFTMILVVSDA